MKLLLLDALLILLVFEVKASNVERNRDTYMLKQLLKLKSVQERQEGESASVEGGEDVDISKYMDPHFAKYGFDGEIPKDVLAYLAYMDDAKNYSFWVEFYKSQLNRKHQQTN